MALKEFFKKALYDLEKNSAGTPYVMSRLKTSELIRDNDRLSLSRFGDGEFGMVIGCGDLGFQPYSQSLHDALTEVLKNGVKTANLSVCIPGVFRSVDEMKPNAASFWMNWCLHSKKKLAPYFVPGYEYGDANVSRLCLPWKDMSYERQIIDNIKSAWFGKTVVIAEGRQTRFGVGNDLLGGAKSISRILCPEKNAWEKHGEILRECEKYPSDGSVVFVLALDPTATVLSYELAKKGYRALDLGHMDLQYEYMLRNADKKCIIPEKYNNEVADGDKVADCRDEEYINSITAVIG